MDTREAARRWIGAWLRGWPAGDVDGIAALYAEDAPYLSHPFRTPDTASSYLARAFGEEDLVDAWFGDPVVDGDRAAVEYWAVLAADNKEITIAGATLLRFGVDGRVVDHRDYWAQVDGRREPASGWGH